MSVRRVVGLAAAGVGALVMGAALNVAVHHSERVRFSQELLPPLPVASPTPSPSAGYVQCVSEGHGRLLADSFAERMQAWRASGGDVASRPRLSSYFRPLYTWEMQEIAAGCSVFYDGKIPYDGTGQRVGTLQPQNGL